VGTPGRIKDLCDKQSLDLSEVQHVVLDEVDHMLDIGFKEQVDYIIQNLYRKGKFTSVILFLPFLSDSEKCGYYSWSFGLGTTQKVPARMKIDQPEKKNLR